MLFLRPTESATVFLQQLGRGSAPYAAQGSPHSPGLHRLPPQGVPVREPLSRADWRHAAGTRATGREGLPVPTVRDPRSCSTRQSQALVLENIRSQIANRWQQIVAELKSYGDQDLPTFLDESGLELSDILRRGSHSWTRLRRDANLPTAPGSDARREVAQACPRIRPRRRSVARDRPTDDCCLTTHLPYSDLSAGEQRLARMLYFSFWNDGGGHESIEAGLAALRRNARRGRKSAPSSTSPSTHRVTSQLAWVASSPTCPCWCMGAISERRSWRAARDFPRMPNSFREGVWYSTERNVDAFFITLKKSEADYSPTTMYADYPISPTMFHWESQSTTSVNSPTGRRYLSGSSTVLLFARHEQKDEFGTSPYLFLGPATYVSHDGRPADRHHMAADTPDARRLLQRRLGVAHSATESASYASPAACAAQRLGHPRSGALPAPPHA